MALNDQIFGQTNIIRQAHGLSSITWDASLAQVIQNYADTCPTGHGGFSGPPLSKHWQNAAGYLKRSGNDYENVKGSAWLWYYLDENFYHYDNGECKEENNFPRNCMHFQTMMASVGHCRS